MSRGVWDRGLGMGALAVAGRMMWKKAGPPRGSGAFIAALVGRGHCRAAFFSLFGRPEAERRRMVIDPLSGSGAAPASTV